MERQVWRLQNAKEFHVFACANAAVRASPGDFFGKVVERQEEVEEDEEELEK